jgi:transcription elongation GreA/GreB family factor
MNATIGTVPAYFNTAPTWGHKTEARAGDTVYLQHNHTVRGVILTTAPNADPVNGKVSILSPIGQALLGRHQGSRVRLSTLDGPVAYRIIKIL